MSPFPEIEIQVVPREHWVETLWLLFGWEQEERRRERAAECIRAARNDPDILRHFLEARRRGERVGVVLAQPLAGRNATIWPPHLIDDEPEETADALLKALDQRLAGDGLVMAQALLPSEAQQPSARLARNGFQRAATLLFLAVDRPQFPNAMPATSLEFEPFRLDQRARLARLIDATYVGTLDAPLLDGVRNTNDVIEGYARTGEFAPDRWFFIRSGGSDVGCLLLTAHPTIRRWELVYMGLTSDARGRRLGNDIARFAQWQAASAADCDGLLVSVDAANDPAVATYARCGFFEVNRRTAWLKTF